jgi:hypothetical protein
MSGERNKSLMFYSLHPNDMYSRQCLDELKKLPELDRQFVKICVHDPRNINGPPQVKLAGIVKQCMQRGLLPIIAVAGFRQPVFAESALSWIKQSVLNKSGVIPSNIHGHGAADNCSTIEQASRSGNTLFDTEYNIGFSTGQGEFNKDYASIDEACQSHIVTYDETSDKGQAAQEIQSKLDQLKFKRDVDVPSARRIGGEDPMGMSQMMGGMPQMPQMGGMPQMPQMGGMPQMPQMMGGMPQMPQMMGGMPQMMGGMPQMPQMMGGMPQMPQMMGKPLRKAKSHRKH